VGRTKHSQVPDELVVGDELGQLHLGAGELLPDDSRDLMVGKLVERVVPGDGVSRASQAQGTDRLGDGLD
jgi:hypothetical protein